MWNRTKTVSTSAEEYDRQVSDFITTVVNHVNWKIQSLHLEKLRFIGKEFITYQHTLISVCEMPQMQQKHLRHLALFLKNSLFLPFEIFNSDENTCRQDSIQKRKNTFDKSIQKVLRLYKLACRSFFNFHFLSEGNKIYVSTVIFFSSSANSFLRPNCSYSSRELGQKFVSKALHKICFLLLENVKGNAIW